MFLLVCIQKESYQRAICLQITFLRLEFGEKNLTICFSFRPDWEFLFIGQAGDIFLRRIEILRIIHLFGISEEKIAAVFVVPDFPSDNTLFEF